MYVVQFVGITVAFPLPLSEQIVRCRQEDDSSASLPCLRCPLSWSSNTIWSWCCLAAALGTVNQYNSTGEKEYTDKYFPYLVWKEPAMHQMLVDVALGGAQAFLQSRRPSSMSERVLLRIDIALTQHESVVSTSFSWSLTTSVYVVTLVQSDKAPHAYGPNASLLTAYMCCSMDIDRIPSCLICPQALSLCTPFQCMQHALHCMFLVFTP